jgi:Tol biopolymer transport system component
MGRRRHGRPAAQVLVAVLCVLALASCALPVPFHDSTVLTQHDGRPSLHRLSWGYPYVESGVWSPDGRWIALVAGPDFSTSHLAVVSADGRTRNELPGWDCDEPRAFDFAWLPNGRLSCLTGRVRGQQHLCVGDAPDFAACERIAVSGEVGMTGDGSSWAPDGQTLWVAASHVLPVTGYETDNPDLLVLTAQGSLRQVFTFSGDEDPYTSTDGGAYVPQWVPQHQALSYEVGYAGDQGPGELVMSVVSQNQAGHFELGPRVVLAANQGHDGYAWSPSGHWVAVRIGGDQGNDHIALVNADNPAQTLDVTNERDVGQFLNPLWSPDGQTLILINTDDDQPYAVDIGSYLASKGLQP